MDHDEDSEPPPYKRGDIKFVLDAPENAAKAFLYMQSYVNYSINPDPNSNNKRPLSHDEQKSILSKEMEMMRIQVEIYLKEETAKQINRKREGYSCMWKRSCGKSIKGAGNFRKHLECHVDQFEAAWIQLIEEYSEWPSMRKTFSEMMAPK